MGSPAATLGSSRADAALCSQPLHSTLHTLFPPALVTMSLTILPRRVALRSTAHSKLWARQFSTVVDDTFAPISPSSAPPPPQSRKGRVLEDAVNATAPRFDWTKDEIREVYNTPLMELAFQSVCWTKILDRNQCASKLTICQGTLHRRFHSPSAVQMCTLMNIKTGGCSEDCSYCAQSSKYNTGGFRIW